MLNRLVEVKPGYDFRDVGYGIHGCEIHFIVSGPKGAVVAQLFTDWFPETAPAMPSSLYRKPWVSDIGFHSATRRRYATHNNTCKVLGGHECWYSGTSTNEEWERGIIHGGTDWLWPRLEALYRHRLEKKGAWPNLEVEPQKLPRTDARR